MICYAMYYVSPGHLAILIAFESLGPVALSVAERCNTELMSALLSARVVLWKSDLS